MSRKQKTLGKNGKVTRSRKKLTVGSVEFIINKAGKMSTKNIAKVLHRNVSTVRTIARRVGVSLKIL